MDKHSELANGNIFPIGQLNTAYTNYFTGTSHSEKLVREPDIPVVVSNITFEPGCRTNWHIHKEGYQLLLVVGGDGWYQEDGKPAQALKTGDVVIIKEGVKHWHGAKNNSWFAHVAITAGKAEWLEPVSEEDYQAVNK